MRLLITRAREDAEPLARRLEKMGMIALVSPLLEVAFLPGPPLDLTAVQAVLMTSANGVRAFCQRSGERSLPVYAVGEATAREAEENGFGTIFTAAGDVDALAGLVRRRGDPVGGTFLHCAGTSVTGDLGGKLESAGFSYRRECLYDVTPARQLSAEARAGFATGQIDGVLLYSPRTAAIFVDLVNRAGLESEMAGVRAYCLSANVENHISGLVWKARRVASVPEQDALVALVDQDRHP